MKPLATLAETATRGAFGIAGEPDVTSGQQVPTLVVPAYLGGGDYEPKPAQRMLCGSVLASEGE